MSKFKFSFSKSLKLVIWTVLVIMLASAGYGYWQYSIRYPSTDDAYVNANVVHIAAQVSGPVSAIYVKNNQHVTKDQLLFTIDAKPFAIAVAKAKAQLALAKQQVAADEQAVATAKAKVEQAQANLNVVTENAPRTIELAAKGDVSKAAGISAQGQIDTTKANLIAAQSQLQQAIKKLGNSGDNNAQIQAAQANLAKAELDLSHTKIYAPTTGNLVNFNLRQGSMITANQDLFALIDTQSFWVDANFKETDLEHIQPGEKAHLHIDTYPRVKFKGYVQSISRGSGSAFALLPPENATGNWVKVTQRFPVKIIITDKIHKYPLRVGSSVKVTIDTQSKIDNS